MIELNTITESKLGSRLEQYRTVISNGSFGYKLAHYIATHYENKELPLMSESHPNSTIKKDPISNRCFSHLSLKHTQNYDNLKAGDFTPYFDDKPKNDLTVEDLFFCIDNLKEYSKNANSRFHLVTPHTTSNSKGLEIVYDWACKIISEIGDKNISEITYDEIISKNSNDFVGDVAKLNVFNKDYYIFPLGDDMWDENNKSNNRNILLNYYNGCIGLFPYEKRSGNLIRPKYITVPKSAIDKMS